MARRQYFQELRALKTSHRRGFISDPGNVWRANALTKMKQSFAKVPPLTKEDKVARTDEEKAEMLMETVFPP